MTCGNAAAVQAVGSREGAHAVMRVARFEKGSWAERPDPVIQEVLIEAFVDGKPAFSATCSPWEIEELVAGRLFFEGVVADATAIDSIALDAECGRVDVRLRRRAPRAREACAIIPFDRPARFSVPAQALSAAVAMLERQSLLFRKTGGVHSAVLADARGTVRAWCEDIGRHSAVDKLAGRCVLEGIDAACGMLLFSGRVPQEIIAKVAALGCPLVASPGAPTTLSVQTAEREGVTLVGFAKEGRFNVYAHPERIV